MFTHNQSKNNDSDRIVQLAGTVLQECKQLCQDSTTGIVNAVVDQVMKQLPKVVHYQVDDLHQEVLRLKVAKRRLNVVMLPVKGFVHEFKRLSIRDIALKLGVQQDSISVKIWKPSVRVIKLANWSDKMRVLHSSFRASLFAQSHLIIKDDSLPEERQQQMDMKHAMSALYAAGFYPTWRRSIIVWFVNGNKFELRHADVLGKCGEDVVDLVKRNNVSSVEKPTNVANRPLKRFGSDVKLLLKL